MPLARGLVRAQLPTPKTQTCFCAEKPLRRVLAFLFNAHGVLSPGLLLREIRVRLDFVDLLGVALTVRRDEQDKFVSV